MTKKSEGNKKVSDKQIAAWTEELRALADKIANAQNMNCAIIMIKGDDEDYGDVAPQLIMEDAFRVNPFGWPQGFDIQLLNHSD